MVVPDSPQTPDRSFANIPVLPPPKRSHQSSPKVAHSPLPLPPIQSPIPTTPKSALRFPQLEPRSRSNSNTSTTRSRSPSPLRKVVFSPKEEHIGELQPPSLSDLHSLNQRDLRELKERQYQDTRDFVPQPPAHIDIESALNSPSSPNKTRSKSVGAESSVSPTSPSRHTARAATSSKMSSADSPEPAASSAPPNTVKIPSFITPVSVAFSCGLVVGLGISAIRPTLEKAVDHGSSWLAWLFKTAALYATIGAAAYAAFILSKAVLVTVQQNQLKQQSHQTQSQTPAKAHNLPPTPRADPFEGLKPHRSSGSVVSASSASSGVSTGSAKSSGSAASIYEFNTFVEKQAKSRKGQKDQEHSFRPYPSRPQLSATAPSKIYGGM